MKCPNCKTQDLVENISFSGIVWNRKKTYTWFCPLCDFENSKSLKINEDEYQAEIRKKSRTTTISYMKGGQNE